jgi:hypothetical protein
MVFPSGLSLGVEDSVRFDDAQRRRVSVFSFQRSSGTSETRMIPGAVNEQARDARGGYAVRICHGGSHGAARSYRGCAPCTAKKLSRDGASAGMQKIHEERLPRKNARNTKEEEPEFEHGLTGLTGSEASRSRSSMLHPQPLGSKLSWFIRRQ